MEPILQVKDLTHTYGAGTPFQRSAVEHMSFDVNEGEFLGIIGHTGSGKSTLIQHLNGLLQPTAGEILLRGKNIWAEPKKIREVRFKVGLVFQYPEYQLFEETVYKDIAFGPANQGKTGDELDYAVREAAKLVGIRDDQLEKSPFELSGGQKRRVALAGVLAMEPEVLVLDEPTAGLDPRQRVAVRNLIGEIAGEKIVLLCTHVVQDVEFIARELILMNQGLAIRRGSPHALEQELEGQVWELTAAEAQLPSMAQYGTVCGVSRQQEGILVRLLSEARPPLPCAPARPGLEDVYLFHFGEGAAL